MPERASKCPLCSGDRHCLFDRRNFHGSLVENQRCLECGLIFQSPRMTPGELTVFYQAEYRRLYGGCENPSPANLNTQQARADLLLRFIRSRIGHIERHLDIGCSTGSFLKKVHESYGCEAVGIEPGKAFRDYARTLNLQVYETLESLRQHKDGLFDLVSMVHVLEHLPDPVSYLRDLHGNFLGLNGWLLIEVPNLYAHNCFEVAHLISFSVTTLKKTLHLAGYQVINIKKHGRPISEFIPYYLTVLARPDPQSIPRPLRAEKFVSLKRKLGLLRSRILLRFFSKVSKR